MGRYFGTDGFRGEAGVGLTADHAFRIGRFLGWYYAEKKRLRGNYTPARIVIGKDTRLSSYMFEYSLIGGIISSGAYAHLLHVTPTPGVAYCAKTQDFDCGIMISASHNPYYDNGIKILNSKGEKMEDKVLDLIEDYLDGSFTAFGKTYTDVPFAKHDKIGYAIDHIAGREHYIQHLIAVGVPMKGVRVGLDCANGASWKIAARVFEELGAEVHLIHAEPNGTNINDHCGSTNMQSLSKLVLEKGLDIGFAYDGDADRCLCVADTGEILNGDHILYMAGRHLKAHDALPDNTVVATVMSNYGLFNSLKKLGIECAKTAVGDKYVYEEMVKNGYVLGGEQSGHIIFLDHATTGDGILTSLKIMEIVTASGKKISKLFDGLETYPQSLTNFRVWDKKVVMDDPDTIAFVKEAEAELDGNGRILLRLSGTEPVVRLLIETDQEDIALKYTARFEDMLREKNYLNT